MQTSSFWYLLFVTTLLVGSVVLFRELSMAVMLLSIAVGDPLYSWLDRTRQRKWFVFYTFAVALFFGLLYYSADLVFFPHSDHASHRLKSAGIVGFFGSFLNLLASYWIATKKRKPLPASH